MRKTKKIEFRVTLTEALIIKNKADKIGCSVSEYLRNTALDYSLAYKLTPDEVEVYKLLNKYADNFRRIGNLFKIGDVTGVKENTIETARLIREHLKKLK
ncbi:plasmid mobilization protein [Myroides odoratimimus]|uniref:plasmid mobilization protein n=1 Tax=Myroides odoratimimus TaxID=76832 RepID=UPI002577E534|nr:mobilization protein [Myroides odoratimimus]MDM1328722.1 mobilization protein [Myroides odoratimimus]